MVRDPGGGGEGRGLRGHLPARPTLGSARRRLLPGLLLGRALALLLILAGVASLVHPLTRAVLGGAPGVLAVLAGSTLLFVLVDPLNLLRRVETRVLGAFLETLFPETAGAGADPVDVAGDLQGLLPKLPLLDRIALRGGAWLLLVSPILLVPSLRPFPYLAREDREAVARAWAQTSLVPMRALFTLMKGTVAMVHFERDAVLEEIGWTPADSGYEEG